MKGKQYRVIKEGLKQRSGDGFVHPKEGDLIQLSEAAAATCIARGFVEAPKVRGRRSDRSEDDS